MSALMQRIAFMLVTVVGVVVGSAAQDVQFPRLTPELLPVLEVLDSAGLSGSLEISGSCDKESFPHLPYVGKKTGRTPLEALSEILSSSAVSVRRDSNGYVRMIDPGVPADFLNVRIHRINFKDDFGNDIFVANGALLAVLEAPEVKTYYTEHDINVVFSMEIFNGPLVASWPPGSPHMSGTLDNVTLGEALDRILHSFSGIWVYEDCRQSENNKRTVFLRFYRLRRRGNSTFVGQ